MRKSRTELLDMSILVVHKNHLKTVKHKIGRETEFLLQSLHSNLRKNDQLKFKATPKIAKINKRGVNIRSGGLQICQN